MDKKCNYWWLNLIFPINILKQGNKKDKTNKMGLQKQ